jgi:hypothetical protein
MKNSEQVHQIHHKYAAERSLVLVSAQATSIQQAMILESCAKEPNQTNAPLKKAHEPLKPRLEARLEALEAHSTTERMGSGQIAVVAVLFTNLARMPK